MNQASTIVEQLSPSEEQRPGIVARGHDIAVVAGAGSGKTRTLVARYLSLLEDGLSMRQMVAVTFTEKAAREMRSRLRQEIARYLQRDDLGDQQRAIWQAHADASSAARIGTIHALCAEMLRTHPAHAGVDPRFNVLDDADRETLYAQVGRDTLSWAINQPDLIELVQMIGSDKVEDLVRTALIKRLDMAEAFELMGDDPWQMWTDAIGQWVREKLDDPGVADDLSYLRELESSGAIEMAIGHRDKLAAPMRRALELWDEILAAVEMGEVADLGRLFAELRQCLAVTGGAAKNWPVQPPKEERKRIFDWYKAVGLDQAFDEKRTRLALDEQSARMLPLLHQLLTYAWERYALLKDAVNALDYDDMEQMALALLSDVAHEDVLAYWREQAQAILVDEFQDTNHRQRDLLSLLNGVSSEEPSVDAPAATAGRLFIVGDAKQSIYRFRGAEVSVFRHERQEIARRGGDLYALNTSYRGHALLVEAINAIMSRIMSEVDDPQRPYAEPFAPLLAFRQDQALGLALPFVECHIGLGSKTNGALIASAGAIADRLVQLVEESSIQIGQGDDARPLAYGDVAILCRATSSFAAYEDALDQSGIPYVTVSGRGFYQRPEIRDLLNLLSAVWDEGDDLALAGALRSPAFGVSDHGLYQICFLRQEITQSQQEDGSEPSGGDSGERLTLWRMLTADGVSSEPLSEMMLDEDWVRLERAIRHLSDWRRQAGRTTVSDLVKRVLDETHYEAMLLAAGQTRAQRNVAKLLSDAHQSGFVSVGDFIEYAQMLREKSVREGEARAASQGAVQIMTIHQAKGLEFPVVVVGEMSKRGGNQSELVLVDNEWGPLLNLKDEQNAVPFMVRLYQQREKDQEEEESRRQLYVALTRARELLLLSGCVDQTKAGNMANGDGWLKWLMDEKLLALAGEPTPCDVEGARMAQDVRLVGETSVACSYYPLQFQPGRQSRLQHETDSETVLTAPFSLVAPPESGDRSGEEEVARPKTLTGLVESRDRRVARLTGHVIHESLAHWSFAAAQIDRLAHRMARASLLDEPAAVAISARAQELLERFTKHPFFAEMSNAPRLLHEVPYTVQSGDGVDQGFVDALYFDERGHWHVVEFKSDHIQDSISLSAFIGSRDYEHQVWRYKRAVRELLQSPPVAHLVLLDFHGSVEVAQIW